MQFSKDLIDPVTGKHEIAGTQTLDRYWDHLDLYVPRSIQGSVLHPVNKRLVLNPELWTYMWSWQWRTNARHAGTDLTTALGEAVRQCKAKLP